MRGRALELAVCVLLAERGPLLTVDVAIYCGVSTGAALAALKRLEVAGVVERFGSPPSWGRVR
ncbi:hypothetical protein [Conexibacter sp. DBS9H8]|uniref:hypothetical protein n=1 Tax=Conexibacter sp. DBS9H8 TaxID=2937801 RepID=UPI00200F17F0|nr:hypothetical protein [Conexibacter sp. DBS9H8]